MVCKEIESRAERGSTLHVGDGVLRVGNTSKGDRYDPNNAENWNIVPIAPRINFTITELENDVKEVSSGEVIVISDAQVWGDFEEGGFDAGDTLQIVAGGTLDVNDRAAIKGGMQLLVEGGGTFTIHDRLDLDEDGVIAMNGGSFHCRGDFKFPDNDTGLECHIWLNAGEMIINDTESRAERGSILHVGKGVLRTGNTSEGGRRDPSNTEEWNIVPIDPNAIVVVTDLRDDYKMVSAAQEVIQISDEQTWTDFEEGGFDDGDMLQILAGGSLTVNERSGVTDGRQLIVEADGAFTMNDRLDMDSWGQIIINGGEFYSNGDFMFPDSSGYQGVDIWLDAGMMVCQVIESRADRSSTLHVGGGVLQTGKTSEDEKNDPENSEGWDIVTIPPYADVVITALENDVKEVVALLPADEN